MCQAAWPQDNEAILPYLLTFFQPTSARFHPIRGVQGPNAARFPSPKSALRGTSPRWHLAPDAMPGLSASSRTTSSSPAASAAATSPRMPDQGERACGACPSAVDGAAMTSSDITTRPSGTSREAAFVPVPAHCRVRGSLSVQGPLRRRDMTVRTSASLSVFRPVTRADR